MKKSLLAALAVTAVLGLSSCSSIFHTSTNVPVQTSVISNATADLEVSQQKISYTFKPSKAVRRTGERRVIETAIAEALKANGNADVLVDPQYVVEQRGFLRGGSVTVIGFPGTYKNFHTMTEAEAKIASEIIDAKSKEQKPQKRFFFF